jgi:predicted NAD/FAD-binding protein
MTPISTQALANRSARPRVAIIGAGIAGLAAADALLGQADVTLFETGRYFGGHANTVDITLEGKTFGVDTGFLVYNERTYPGLIAMLTRLGVAVAPSDMGFSVQAQNGGQRTEWAGNSLASVFAQKGSWRSARHWRMLMDIVRFNRLATAWVTTNSTPHNFANDVAKNLGSTVAPHKLTVGEFLDLHRFSGAFIENYFLPMIACIWSCPLEQMKAYPLSAMLVFCHNHGLLQITNRPQWFTIQGGSRQYVNAILATINDKRLETPVHAIERTASGVTVLTAKQREQFDSVILACHPDQSLAILGNGATKDEKSILGAIRYQDNTAVLHTDTQMMPHSPAVWAAWNYERQGSHENQAPTQTQPHLVCLHYWLNKLQPLPTATPVIVSLNPIRQPAPQSVIQTIHYAHPIFDADAIEAQQKLPNIQGLQRTWFAGAWCQYGFHEDGYQAGLAAAKGVLKA